MNKQATQKVKQFGLSVEDMKNYKAVDLLTVVTCTLSFAGVLVIAIPARAAGWQVKVAGNNQASGDADLNADGCNTSTTGSPYIPVDSWIYPAVLRLHSLGFLDTVFIGMRPWTRASLAKMLVEVNSKIEDANEGP